MLDQLPAHEQAGSHRRTASAAVQPCVCLLTLHTRRDEGSARFHPQSPKVGPQRCSPSNRPPRTCGEDPSRPLEHFKKCQTPVTRPRSPRGLRGQPGAGVAPGEAEPPNNRWASASNRGIGTGLMKYALAPRLSAYIL